MKIAICEDELIYMNLIKQKVVTFFKEKNIQLSIDSYSDAVFLPQKIKEGREYDLILMDLQMKHSDGMRIISGLRSEKIQTPVIFVSGIETRATEGYSVEAIDYILKSDMENKLPEALARFMGKHGRDKIAVPEKNGGTVIIKASEILWVESDGRGSRIVTESEEKVSSLSISKLSEMLPEFDFVEIYKSIYVKIPEIKRIENDTITLSNDKKLPLSRRKRNDVLNAVLRRMKGNGL